jgi:hypothetical protein
MRSGLMAAIATRYPESGFDAAILMKSGLFEAHQHMVVGCLGAELRSEPLSV